MAMTLEQKRAVALASARMRMAGRQSNQTYSAMDNPSGLVAPGNLDINARQVFNAPDGSYRTENSISIGTDKGEVLIPTIINGRQVSNDEAIAHFNRTGENLGTFRDPQSADNYAQALHNRQAERYNPRNQQRIDEATATANEPMALPQDQKPGIAEDVTKSGASGMARGTADLLGLPGTLGDLGQAGVGYALRKGYQLFHGGREPNPNAGGIERFFAGADMPQSPLGGEAIRGYMSKVTSGATDYQPKTVPGEYARTVGEFLPGAATFGGLSPSNIVRYGALPAVASETAGQATKGTALEPYARTGAAIAAPFAAGAGARVVTPYRGTGGAERAKQVALLEKEGVPLTAGQRIGSKALQYKEAKANGEGIADLVERQARAFTSAVLRRIGVQADAATPEVISKAASDIGQRFDVLAANNSIGPDRTLVNDLVRIRRQYVRDVPDIARTGTLDSAIQDVADSLRKTNGIPGDVYQNLRSEVARAARGATNNNPLTDKALRDFVDAIDSAMERSIKQNNPNMIGDWKEARRLYRNLLVIEKASTGAGEMSALGFISPAQLKNATMNIGGKRAYARGKGEFAALARAGEATMKPLPQSGTAPRLQALTASLPAIIGGGVGSSMGPYGAMAGAAAGAILPKIADAAVMSRPGQAYLGNRVASSVTTMGRRDLGNVLLRTISGNN